jgi:hypothetical protein
MSVSAFSSTVAQAIVSYREDKGAYKRLEDLKNVSGMRNATKPLINGFVSVKVRLHAPHSSHGGLGTRPTLILLGKPRWIDD